MKSNVPIWFTRNKEELSFITSRNMKLINITSHLFRLHFLDQINMKIAGDGIDSDDALRIKEALLSPLGLPNTDVQKTIVKKRVHERERPTFCSDMMNGDNMTYLAEFIRFHRYSGTRLDLELVSMMKELYGEHVDGYIQPMKIPTDEVCIFDIGLKTNMMPLKNGGAKKSKRVQKGGGGDPRENPELFFEIQKNMRAVLNIDDRDLPLVVPITDS